MEWGKKKEEGVEGIKDGMREEEKNKKKEWEKKRGVCEAENQSDDNSPPRLESLSRSNNVETKKNINIKNQ